MSDVGKAIHYDLVNLPALRSVAPARVMTVIIAASLGVFGFLFWLVYFKEGAGYTSRVIGALPAVNASLNAVSSVLLVLGLRAVRRREYVRHMRLMLGAVLSSALFFVSYVVYHHFHGDTKFTGAGVIRYVYFFILITHIVLSAVAVPLILTSLWLSLAGKLAAHRRVSRYTFPVWLYVSVTGVLIFVMLKAFG